MHRRTLLQRGAAVGTVALAGCLGQGDGSPAGNDAGVPDETRDPGDGAIVTDVAVETLDSNCGRDDGPTADVRFDEAEGTIAIAGLLHASDPCHRVTVESTSYDPESDVLAVALGTTPGDEDTCAQCTATLEFEATVTVDGEFPETVSVRQTDVQLARVERGEATPTPDEVSLDETSFEVTGRTSASDDPTADVSFEADSGRVVVTGTIHGSDGCQTAALGGVEHDLEADRVQVDVVTEPRPGSEDRLCTQERVAISYEVVLTFTGSVPGRVAVNHDGQGIVSAGHGTATARPPATATSPATDG